MKDKPIDATGTMMLDGMAFLNQAGEPVFLAGDVLNLPEFERFLDMPSDLN